MVWKDSILVPKNFNDIFRLKRSIRRQKGAICEYEYLFKNKGNIMDHFRIIEHKDTKNRIYTSSEYVFNSYNKLVDDTDDKDLKIVIFNPKFYNYYGFVDSDANISNLNIGFTFIDDEDLKSIFDEVFEKMKVRPFLRVK